jgi:hypothetical protein
MDRSSFSQAAVALFDTLDTERAGVLYLDDLRNIMNRVSQRFKTIVEGVLHSHIFEKRSFIMTKQEFMEQYSTTMLQWHSRKGSDKENIRVVSVKPVVVEHSSVTTDAIAAFKLLQPQQTKLKPSVKTESRRGRSPQPGVRCLIERRSSNVQRRPSSRGSSARPSSIDTSQADLSMAKASVDSTRPPSRTSSSCSFRGRPAPGVFKQLYSADMERLMEIRRAHLDVSRGM